MIHDGSCECMMGSVDLFSTPPTQTSILQRSKVEFHPVANVSDSGPIEFYISPCDEDYFDLSDHTLELQCKIVKLDGTSLPADAHVGFVNHPLHSLFSQVDVHLNEKLITIPSNTYPYKAYLEKFLTYGPHARKSQFSCELFVKDSAGKMDAVDGTNKGLNERSGYTKESKSVTLRGSLHVELFRQERFLINKCNLRIKLIPHDRKFYIMGKEDGYKVKIESARLEVMKVKMNPSVLNDHSLRIMKSTVKYPVRRSEIKSFSIPSGNLSTVKESLFSGQVPRRLIIGLLDSKAVTGDVKKNPFNFQHFSLNYLCCHVNGDRIPNRALTPDFTNGNFVRAYETLFTGMGIRNEDKSVEVRRVEYAEGYTLYILRLCAGEADSIAYDLVQNGTVRLEMKFKTPLPTTVTALVYAEFDNIIEIDRDRNVILDY